MACSQIIRVPFSDLIRRDRQNSDSDTNVLYISTCQPVLEMQLQVLYAILDQVFHGSHPLDKDMMSLVEHVHKQYYSLPCISNACWHLRFGHFVGYGAKYYSYLMSKAVASKVWHQCFKQDPLNRQAGDAYRYKMLAHGGGRHPRLLVKDMLNEDVSSDMLVNAILDDLDSHS